MFKELFCYASNPFFVSTMSDQSALCILIFTGLKEDWSIWSEQFLAKSKRHGYKDVLLGKETIPKSGEVIDDKSIEGKAMSKLIELNELAYSELVLSMDVKRASGKVAFQILQRVASQRTMKMGMQLWLGNV